MFNDLPEYPRTETILAAIEAQRRNCALYVIGTREHKAAERRLDRIRAVLNQIKKDV